MLMEFTVLDPAFEQVAVPQTPEVSPNTRGNCDVRLWPRSWKDVKETEGIT
jgi:hypothetical protein